MEKVRPWCGQPSDRRRLKHRTASVIPEISLEPQKFTISSITAEKLRNAGR